MNFVTLGKTGLIVSKMCFGTLGMGPLQLNMSPSEGAALIKEALRLGINFFDTAEIYETYSHLRQGLNGVEDVVVASKSYAYTREGMRRSVDKARLELGRDVIDIFMLHEQESGLTLRGHQEALDYLIEARERGIVRAVGVSTHYAEVVEILATMPEFDVVHAIVNRDGIGVKGGLNRMLRALQAAKDAGKGVYAMKALAGGRFYADFVSALQYVRDLKCVDSVAVGVSNVFELEADAAVLSGLEVPAHIKQALNSVPRQLAIEPFCEGCGKCCKACQFGALSLVGGKSTIDRDKCVLCGYCVAACPGYYIKIGESRAGGA